MPFSGKYISQKRHKTRDPESVSAKQTADTHSSAGFSCSHLCARPYGRNSSLGLILARPVSSAIPQHTRCSMLDDEVIDSSTDNWSHLAAVEIHMLSRCHRTTTFQRILIIFAEDFYSSQQHQTTSSHQFAHHQLTVSVLLCKAACHRTICNNNIHRKLTGPVVRILCV